MILTVVSLPTQLHCLRIRSVSLVATVGFDDTADGICSADDGNESQQSFGNFEGGLQQFWVTFGPRVIFYPEKTGKINQFNAKNHPNW